MKASDLPTLPYKRLSVEIFKDCLHLACILHMLSYVLIYIYKYIAMLSTVNCYQLQLLEDI